MYSVTFEPLDIELELNRSTLLYLSDLPAKALWELRSYSGHQREKRKHQQLEGDALLHFTRDHERFKRALEDPLDEIREIFNTILSGEKPVVEQVIPDTKFYFIVGHMRSGGTYLLKELLKIHGDQLEDFNQGMIHDGCPHYRPLRLWRQSEETQYQLLFDFAQLLYWTKHEFEHSDVVVKKRMGFAHAMPVLDFLFGDRATYLVTLRHPEEAAESFAELEGISNRDSRFNHPSWKERVRMRLNVSDQQWESFNYYEQFLHHWTAYYMDLVRDGTATRDNFVPLRFGKSLESYLKEKVRRINVPVEVEPFHPTQRTRGKHLSPESIDDVVQTLRDEWSKVNVPLPDL